ncbi:hypothetical protein YC2023_071365 [Brassica napus]
MSNKDQIYSQPPNQPILVQHDQLGAIYVSVRQPFSLRPFCGFVSVLLSVAGYYILPDQRFMRVNDHSQPRAHTQQLVRYTGFCLYPTKIHRC